MSTLSGIQDFYQDVIAPVESNVIMPASRIHFLAGSGIAVAFLVQNVVRSAFWLIVNVFALFLDDGCRDLLLKSVEEIPVYLGAIPVGLLGALFPQTINQHVVGIPSDGITLV